jgi:hypothetical protein
VTITSKVVDVLLLLGRKQHTSREKPTAGAPNLLTAGELQLASDTNAGGNALSLAHFIFVGDNFTYCRRIATFARGNVLPLVNIAMRRQ